MSGSCSSLKQLLNIVNESGKHIFDITNQNEETLCNAYKHVDKSLIAKLDKKAQHQAITQKLSMLNVDKHHADMHNIQLRSIVLKGEIVSMSATENYICQVYIAE